MKVRTGAFIALGLALVASPGYAQNVTGGVKGGINFATASNTGFDDTSQKTGAVVGGYIEDAINQQFSIQPEFLYTMKGAKGTVAGTDVTSKVNGIEIPVLAKFKFATKSQAHPFVLAGPGFGFVTTAKVEVNSVDTDIKDQIQTFDPTFLIGGGVGIVKNLEVEARYDFGLRDLSKTSGVDSKSRTFSILVGYRFGKTK
jgi:hypothetical protein